jgi:hypothetical protein
MQRTQNRTRASQPAISRRQFLGWAGLGLSGAAGLRLPLVHGAVASDRLVVLIQAVGGWDVTSFCDPKLNVAGEREINTWATSAGIGRAGNLDYAPFGGNRAFFDKYHDRTLVVNGIDAQTNSHSAGVVHTWSGRLSEGYPSLSALFTGSSAPDLPMSYLNFGGYAETAGIARYTRVDNPKHLKQLAAPNRSPWEDGKRFFSDPDFERIRAYRRDRLEMLTLEGRHSARGARNRRAYETGMQNVDKLGAFADLIPDDDALQPVVNIANRQQHLRRQIQIALLAFKSGTSVAADLVQHGYDTHKQHDVDHAPLLQYLTEAIDYLWEEAEALGLAERIVLVVGSDFGRTPFYNGSAGKDHWPIGSVLIQEKNAPWGGRAIGLTDEGHRAVALDPVTMRPAADGTRIFPRHVHHALRGYLGLNDGPLAARFPFAAVEDLPLFA